VYWGDCDASLPAMALGHRIERGGRLTRWLKFAAVPVLLALGYLAGSVVASPGQAGPGGGDGGQENCLDGANKVEDPGDTLTINAPSGQIVGQVAIKSVSDNQEGFGCFLYPPLTSGQCYTVSGLGTAVVRITRIGSGSDCKEISHIELTTTPGTTPTTTTTTTASPKTSATPTTTDPKTTMPTP
jgi:hypothetical protein